LNLDATFTDGSLAALSAIAVAGGLERIGSVVKACSVELGVECTGGVIAGNEFRTPTCFVTDQRTFILVGFLGLREQQLPAYLAGLREDRVEAIQKECHPSAKIAALQTSLLPIHHWLRTLPYAIIAGHSYGGVLADALDVVVGSPGPMQQRVVITFGTPRPVPVGTSNARERTKRWAWQRQGDGIVAFPPQGNDNPPISLVLSDLIGGWPADFMHTTRISLLQGSGLWIALARPQPLSFFAPATLPLWVLAERGSISVAHSFVGYALDLAALETPTPKLWNAMPETLLAPADSPPAFSNGLITLREQAGFPMASTMRC